LQRRPTFITLADVLVSILASVAMARKDRAAGARPRHVVVHDQDAPLRRAYYAQPVAASVGGSDWSTLSTLGIRSHDA
jgi:hypothetical protein